MTRRIGYAPGVYDMFHIGHLNILSHAASQCDYLIAGVVSDEMARLAKGRNPVIPLAERIAIVASINCVDEAIAETKPHKIDTWRDVGFDAIFKGDDWRGTPKGLALEREFAAVGVEVVYFPYTLDTSSTLLRAALEKSVNFATDRYRVDHASQQSCTKRAAIYEDITTDSEARTIRRGWRELSHC